MCRQEISTAMGVSSVLRRTSQRLSPSIPTW